MIRQIEIPGDHIWRWYEEYGWVNEEDDPAMMSESAMLDEIERLRSEMTTMHSTVVHECCEKVQRLEVENTRLKAWAKYEATLREGLR